MEYSPPFPNLKVISLKSSVPKIPELTEPSTGAVDFAKNFGNERVARIKTTVFLSRGFLAPRAVACPPRHEKWRPHKTQNR